MVIFESKRVFCISSVIIVLLSTYLSSANASVQLLLTEGQSRILFSCTSSTDALDEITPKMDWAKFLERDLDLVSATGNSAYLNYFVDGDVQRSPLYGSYVDRIIEESNCNDDTSFVLIGKDGRVKYRWQNNVATEELFEIIDAMPMRQFEMMQKIENK